jgi:probable HAF family extracellular repeat protein
VPGRGAQCAGRLTGLPDAGRGPLTHAMTFYGAGAINDAGVVVGESEAPFASGARSRAFIHVGGKMHDLNRLTSHRHGFELMSDTAINYAVRIAGYGKYRGGLVYRAFLLTPIQKPSLAP